MVSKLDEVAIDGEVMLALANGVMICRNVTICWWGGGNILDSWLQSLRYAGITNYLIAALDDETEKYLVEDARDTRFFRPDMKVPEQQKGSHPANQVPPLGACSPCTPFRPLYRRASRLQRHISGADKLV
jgi:hypothetical protein